jgi:hypothetical protein
MRILESNNLFERLRIGLGVIFTGMGFWIIFGDIFPPQMDSQYQILMGLVFVFYGLYRVVHIPYQRNFQKHGPGVTDDTEDPE